MNRMKRFLAGCCIASSACAHGEEIVLTNGEWLPYQSEHLKHHGVVSHIVSEAFALEGIEVAYRFHPWKRAYADAESGKANGSIVWSHSPEREAAFYFSDVVLEGKTVFFHLKSDPFEWNTFEDLVGFKIGGTLGYEYLFEDYPGVHIERAASDSDNFKKLLAKRFRIFPSDLDVGYTLLHTDSFSEQQRLRITHHPRPYNRTEYHLILSRQISDSPRLLERFNRGLMRLRQSGRYNQYMEASQRGEYLIAPDKP